MILMLSVHPEYCERILSGQKRVEYRRKIYKHNNGLKSNHVDTIVLYETAPTCKVVGEVAVSSVEAFTPNVLWNKTCEFGGIDKESYDSYFTGCMVAYGIMLRDPVRYPVFLELSDFEIPRAPQSFVYVTTQAYYNVKHNVLKLSEAVA